MEISIKAGNQLINACIAAFGYLIQQNASWSECTSTILTIALNN